MYTFISPHFPFKNLPIETWALMRHHGAPTRLLDFSYSFYVAAYFSISGAEVNTSCCIWMLNKSAFRDSARKQSTNLAKWYLTKDGNAKNENTIQALLIGKPDLKVVHPLNTYRLNERLAAQQGTFVLPIDMASTFEDNLLGMGEEFLKNNLKKLKIELNAEEMRKAIYELNRMNINRATLFPGINGLAGHMEDIVSIDEARAV